MERTDEWIDKLKDELQIIAFILNFEPPTQ